MLIKLDHLQNIRKYFCPNYFIRKLFDTKVKNIKIFYSKILLQKINCLEIISPKRILSEK